VCVPEARDAAACGHPTSVGTTRVRRSTFALAVTDESPWWGFDDEERRVRTLRLLNPYPEVPP
jgi:hypothetical protein